VDAHVQGYIVWPDLVVEVPYLDETIAWCTAPVAFDEFAEGFQLLAVEETVLVPRIEDFTSEDVHVDTIVRGFQELVFEDVESVKFEERDSQVEIVVGVRFVVDSNVYVVQINLLRYWLDEPLLFSCVSTAPSR
jgi:hypothetical protein